MLTGIARNGLLIATVAHGLEGISLVWDKVLLRTPAMRHIAPYVFWLGAMSIGGLLLIPFGFHMPEPWVALLSFGTGILQVVAIYAYYAALKAGEASQALAIVGGFSPLATALIGVPLLDQRLSNQDWAGFALLTLGGFVMFLSEPLHLGRVIPLVIIASLGFGMVNVFKKVVFDHTNFVSGYVVFTLGTVAGALAMLLRPGWRVQIFKDSESAPPRSRFWYFVNRFISGVGSFLIYYAISLANPAVVDSISGVRYVIIFLGALALTRLRPEWLREDFSRRTLMGKTAATLMIVLGLALLGLSGGGETRG